MAEGRATNIPVIIGQNSGEAFFQNARKIAGLSEGPTFLYRFEYVPEWRQSQWPNGAIHSGEIMYTFDSLDTSSWGGEQVTATDRAVGDRVHSCWVAFMKAPAGTTQLECAEGFEWPAYTVSNDQAAVIGETFKLSKAADLPDGPPRP